MHLFMVTADPTEGEAQTETGVNLVEAVAMPDVVRELCWKLSSPNIMSSRPFYKRKRDRADPEALGSARAVRIGDATMTEPRRFSVAMVAPQA